MGLLMPIVAYIGYYYGSRSLTAGLVKQDAVNGLLNAIERTGNVLESQNLAKLSPQITQSLSELTHYHNQLQKCSPFGISIPNFSMNELYESLASLIIALEGHLASLKVCMAEDAKINTEEPDHRIDDDEEQPAENDSQEKRKGRGKKPRRRQRKTKPENLVDDSKPTEDEENLGESSESEPEEDGAIKEMTDINENASAANAAGPSKTARNRRRNEKRRREKELRGTTDEAAAGEGTTAEKTQ